MHSSSGISRREFFGVAGLAVGGVLSGVAADASAEPIIDIHQHTNYSGRTDEQLIAHQKAMGVTQTVLLPAGKYYGLDAQCGGNDTCVSLAKRLPGEYVFFANEMPYLAEADAVIRQFLKAGAIGIGEQKFRVMVDSGHIAKIAKLAEEFGVPVLMHFQETDYNLEFGRFHKTLAKFPKVNFIGHAQTFWANIDKNYDGGVLYPTGAVTPGGLTDRYLADYPNMFADLSAGSGLNAAVRDEEHYKGFMERHQDKLLYGSDCNDTLGRGPGCSGAQMIAMVRKLAPTKVIERKLLYENARKLFRLAQK
jgi:predicted TIM-barrel fold metal-dependent hydrolase